MDRQALTQDFLGFFGGEAAGIRVFTSPGRVNLIGEHTDYNGGFVFPAALTLATTVLARPRTDRTIRLVATDLRQVVVADLDDLQKSRGIPWGAYQLGVADELMKAGFPLVGCDLLYEDKVPLGSGLSSSAAIEVATAFALVSLGAGEKPVAIDPIHMAKISQTAEHNFIGVMCGIMDQFASAMGKKDHAIFLDCQTLAYEWVPLVMEGVSIVIANTNHKRSLGEGKYNERRAECETGLEILKAALPAITCLRDVSAADFEQHGALIADPVVRNRVAHVVYEDDRVLRSVEALKQGDLVLFGQLMDQSHDSLRDLYEVTGMKLDALVDAFRACDGVIGSRMTGAGFGGCAVALVKTEAVEAVKEKVGAAYLAKVGHPCTFYVSDIGDGAKEVVA